MVYDFHATESSKRLKFLTTIFIYWQFPNVSADLYILFLYTFNIFQYYLLGNKYTRKANVHL